MGRTILSATCLGQGYGRTRVIHGIDLQVEAEVYGLLGPNGAGKTTLLRTLATVVPALDGELSICGVQVTSERTARQARRHVAYLPQEFGFYPSFTVYEFVRYCAWLREVPSRVAHDATLSALASVGLLARSRSKMKTLSGGMVRRAGIAASLVGSPELLLLDEPTSGLDPAQRLEFRRLIKTLTGTAIILSTHLVEDVAAVCDRVAVMSDGRFVFSGSASDLAGSAAPSAFGDSAMERGYMTALGDAAPVGGGASTA